MIEPTDRVVSGRHCELAVREWSGTNPGWIALISHGYGEHSGRYQWVAEQLVGARALVYAPDHVGHGRSPGDRVYFEDAETVVADLETLRREVAAEHPELPVVLIGHSMGGMLAARYAQEHQEHLAAVVLSAPVLGTWHVLDLLEHDVIPDTPIDPATLSRDPEVGAAYVADPLVWHGPIKRATLQAVDDCLLAINDGPMLDKPTLWVHGEDDELVPEADTRTGIDRIRGSEFHEHIYPGGRHELLNETNKAEVMNDILTFIGRELNS
ncbi:alpha/beta hydrolase [Saccharopolyspora spinosa]|uniref:Alpha-beta hydrolase superfamily lysophospholipase n=1 Tax=Saccharopolyspora spinosa TaxID=60894 RepID=A0A2N3XTQ5_SACSN|nr:alpha/beta hydrolase [Saccharopolyspora spinosa]PKW14068.1 alpha-beta hydrolase superfamily lysophospholipase [Saccharopolyspora spinosa]